jgi:hypothetical protein
MGIQIETTVYGPQLARELAAEPEEFAYALQELLDFDAAKLGAEIYGDISYGETDNIVGWLRSFADAIEAEDANG